MYVLETISLSISSVFSFPDLTAVHLADEHARLQQYSFTTNVHWPFSQ